MSNAIILKHEKTVFIDNILTVLSVGDTIPVLREYIAKDPNSHPNRIVECEIVSISRDDEYGYCVFQIYSSSFCRIPWITIDQIECTFTPYKKPRLSDRHQSGISSSIENLLHIISSPPSVLT